jgi:two-component system, LytTR family, response regulator
MTKINCIIIDDEPPAIRQMEEYISNVPYLKLTASFDNAIDALDYLKESRTDLIFLDIQMETLTGIQFLNVLKDKPRVILTTAFDDYALKAFDLNVTDYLLKPISFERFLQATEKIYKHFFLEQTSGSSEKSQLSDERDYFFVKTEFRVERVDFNDILYIEGLKEYLGICTANKKILTLQNFNDILDTLPSSNFIRVHKSYIVAVNKITSIERNHILIGDKLLPIGPTYKDDFFNTLKSRKLI